MINQELLQKIRLLKIHTKRLMHSMLSGDYLSAFKGSGLEFNQIREYQMGDDIRAIDWNSSAKINKIMVKQFIEERDRTIILAIDISASNTFGSQHELRKEAIANLAGTLALVASNNKDHIGALFFSDVIEQWIPPKKGAAHVNRIIQTLYTIQTKRTKTDISAALRFLISSKTRNAVLFLISDWIDNSSKYEKLLKITSLKYDFVSIRMLDPVEKKLPTLGLLEITDPETSQTAIIDTRHAHLANNPLGLHLLKRQIEQKRMFEKYRIDLLDIEVAQHFINPLVQFFHQRIRRQI